MSHASTNHRLLLIAGVGTALTAVGLVAQHQLASVANATNEVDLYPIFWADTDDTDAPTDTDDTDAPTDTDDTDAPTDTDDTDAPTDTDDTDAPTDTDTPTDTDPPDDIPPTAAELAGETGGCHCNSSGSYSWLWLLTPVVLLGRRRRS